MEHSHHFPITPVVSDAVAVDLRLLELGTSRDLLTSAILAGELQRRLCTEHDPPAAAGFFAWARTVRALRDLHAERHGWFGDDTGMISTAVNPERTMAIMVATGDSDTGRATGRHPQTKYPKGIGTITAVERNGQMDLFGMLAGGAAELDPEFVEASGPLTWMLLVHSDRSGVWAELSRPNGIGESGHVSGWSERILLGHIDPSDPGASLNLTDAAPVHPTAPIDVPVARRFA